MLALQRQPARPEPYELRWRRDTTVLAANVMGRVIASAAAATELYRVDPVATRAGFRSELLSVDGVPSRGAAKIVELFPGSPLPGAGISLGESIIALQGRGFGSAQELVSRLHREHELGDAVILDVYDGRSVRRANVRLWNPGRRISQVSLGPLLQYRSSLSPESVSLDILDLWLFSVYSYSRSDAERSYSLFGLFNFSTGYGELTEEAR